MKMRFHVAALIIMMNATLPCAGQPAVTPDSSSQSVPAKELPYKLYNPLPTHLYLYPEQIEKLERDAYNGDEDAAVRLHLHYGLVMNDLDTSFYWSRIAAQNGSLPYLYFYYDKSKKLGLSDTQAGLLDRFVIWACEKYSRQWPADEIDTYYANWKEKYNLDLPRP